MQKIFATLALGLLLSMPTLATVSLAPGIAFFGFVQPYITTEVSFNQLQSIKLFINQEGLITSFRAWPETDEAWPLGESIPIFFGLGLRSTWQDGMSLDGFYAEAGVKIVNLFEVGFALENFGANGRITINLGVSFSFGGGDQGG